MHYFKDFKNFSNATLDLFKPMTLMIGRNGSGKSNVIEAVELLAQIAHGRPLYEISDIGRGSGTTFQIRGGLRSCLRYTEDIFGSYDGEPTGNFELGFDTSYRNKRVSYRVKIGVPESKIVGERLEWGDRVIFESLDQVDSNSDLLNFRYDNFSRGGKKPIAKLSADRSVLSQYIYFSGNDGEINKSQKDAYKLVQTIKYYLNLAFVFDPDPKSMRNYEREGQLKLNRDASNLSSVLYSLKTGDDSQQKTLKRIFENLNQLPQEPFKDFHFVQTSLKDVILAFKRHDDSIVDARLLSDGTLRALAILTALETVPELSRIVIEEMDNGIHPSRVEMLVDAIWEASNRRKLNVLATTHNPATLDCLDEMQLDSVVLCYYDNIEYVSKLCPLKEIPLSEVLLERGRLGDLVTKRVIEQHLVPNYSEDRKKKALAWLESMQ